MIVYILMMSTKVLSVRVRRELKEEAERMGINIKEVVERALEKAIFERREELLRRSLKEFRESMEGLPEAEWVKAIRKTREER